MARRSSTRRKSHAKKDTRTRRKKSRSTTRSKTFKRSRCAPRKGKQLSFTCYSPENLEYIKQLWNSRHPDKAIETDDSKEIWTQLKKNMSECCSNERDWLRHNFMKQNLSQELLNYTFAPDSPDVWREKPDEWLTSIDILNVMKQYEHIHPDFEFIGPSPIDYDTHMVFGECVWEELCNFNLESYIKRNVKHIGVVFNLDPHYKEGSHWVALFISIKHGCICFFDSYGEKPEKQINKFMNMVKTQANGLGLDMHKHVIENRHQYSDSECGMYCLYFIIQMLNGKKAEYFEKNRIPDKKMLELRKKYFN